MSPLVVIEPVDGFAPAAPVPAAKLEENVNPLTGLRQVTVNWPTVPVGAAQTGADRHAPWQQVRPGHWSTSVAKLNSFELSLRLAARTAVRLASKVILF